METDTSSTSPRIIRMADACRKTGLCQSTLYALIARGVLPKPFQLVPGGRAVGWFEADLDLWLNRRKRESQQLGMKTAGEPPRGKSS